jgi:hypothetical protein
VNHTRTLNAGLGVGPPDWLYCRYYICPNPAILGLMPTEKREVNPAHILICNWKRATTQLWNCGTRGRQVELGSGCAGSTVGHFHSYLMLCISYSLELMQVHSLPCALPFLQLQSSDVLYFICNLSFCRVYEVL